ncbi:hypothetical protein DL98DRAFT_535486 [Cadophora sp. DSE1049]|nr:hypothetical protein DL98DRAFT_535486 [Cadophora sp. DSE1049]
MSGGKVSRFKPLNPDEAWGRLVQASKHIQVLQRLSDAEVQRSFEAVDTLKKVQPSGKIKRYKEFLYDVLRHGRQYVLLCAMGLGQARVLTTTNGGRAELLGIIKANKGNPDIDHPALRPLAIEYQIPESVTGLFILSVHDVASG